MTYKIKFAETEMQMDEELEGWMTEAQWADALKSPTLAAELCKLAPEVVSSQYFASCVKTQNLATW
eukprot:2652824-Pyramimonas_sp.AAC.1